MANSADNTQLTIISTAIRRDAEGRYCLNDCHKASGGEETKRPSRWLENSQTQALIVEIEGSAGIPAHPIKTVMTGNNEQRGTYAVKELVYAYAMWINPTFHLQVIRAFDAMTTGQIAATPISREQQIAQALMLAQDIVKEKEVQLAELKPKATVYDAIISTDGLFTLTTTAKLLKQKLHGFMRYLEANKWLYRLKSSGRPQAYQPRIDAGYVSQKVYAFEKDGEDKASFQVLFTVKGVIAIAKRLGVEIPDKATLEAFAAMPELAKAQLTGPLGDAAGRTIQ